jgi:hypothetical protein
MAVKCKIIVCSQWGAKPPKHGLQLVPQSKRIIFHHTAGHHAEISDPKNESIAESKRYARDIQAFHMGRQRGWTDTGQNFLVCRNGAILQGRHLTVSAIEARHMVMSAHCPGQNDQIGIEHEHVGSEPMTKAQKEASARLMAWIADRYGRKTVLPVDPHSKHFPTSCPANLKSDIAAIRKRAQQILTHERGK